MPRRISNINSSLRGGRRREHIKHFGLWIIFILLLISLCILALTWQGIRIHDFKIYGNESVTTKQISDIVDEKLNERYIGIIPTDNFLLLKRGEIEQEILNNIKKINSVSVSFKDLNNVEVYVSERVPQSLWCDGTPIMYTGCYFMDRNGFIFASAPEISGNTFMKYFGLVNESNSTSTKMANPIGQSYFEPNVYSNMSRFNKILVQMKFDPIAFNAISIHEYEVSLGLSGKIYLNDKKTFERDIVDLQALIDGGYVKNDLESLQKLQYLDLRYGNKVIIK